MIVFPPGKSNKTVGNPAAVETWPDNEARPVEPKCVIIRRTAKTEIDGASTNAGREPSADLDDRRLETVL